MKQLTLKVYGGYEGMMNSLSYYKGDILCYGQNPEGKWFILGTEK